MGAYRVGILQLVQGCPTLVDKFSLNCMEHVQGSELGFWCLVFLSLSLSFPFCSSGFVIMGRCPRKCVVEPVSPWQLPFYLSNEGAFFHSPVSYESVKPSLPNELAD